jgi:hypothetical protein
LLVTVARLVAKYATDAAVYHGRGQNPPPWKNRRSRIYSVDPNGIRQITRGQAITEQKNIEQELRYKDAPANQAEAITDIGHFIYDEIKQKFL